MKRIRLSSPDIGEEELQAARRVLQSGQLSLGAEIPAFESEFADYLGSRHAVAVSSGTAGLHCVIRGLGIGEGDEVITTPFSFIASANCILFEKAKPVFAEIDPQTLCLDPSKIEERITPRTKAILVVHVLGVSCDMDRIGAIAERHNLFVIEDACEAIGTTWKNRKVGTFGRAGVFAFYPNKQMTTGEGGMIVTGDPELAAFYRSVRNQGRSAHDGNVFDRLGYNYRMSDLHAAIGRAQLAKIGEILKMRREVAEAYASELRDVEEIILPPGLGEDSTSWFVFLIRLSERFGPEDRREIRRLLAAEGIDTGAYFSPIHLQEFYRRQFGFKPGDFPVTESICERTIALPFHNRLGREEIHTVCEKLVSNLFARRS